MPRRELKSGKQVADWLGELSSNLQQPGNITLIGGGCSGTGTIRAILTRSASPNPNPKCIAS